MPYVPPISNYKPFYMQAAGDETAWDTRDYGFVAQTQPFPESVEVKDLYKNDWLDENGDDEYAVNLYLRAFEYTVRFYVKTFSTDGSTAIDKLNYQVKNFRAKLLRGEFKIWDSWQERGFQKVRLVKQTVEDRNVTDDYAWMIIAVTMKVNDPATEVEFSSNTIIAAE